LSNASQNAAKAANADVANAANAANAACCLLRLRLQTHAHGNTAATHQIFVKATLNI